MVPWYLAIQPMGDCYISTSPPSEVRSKGTNNRYRTWRPGHSALLDRFVKQTSVDGSLIAKAPVHLKCSASFFDKEGNMDLVRNYSIRMQRDESNRLEKVNRRKEVRYEGGKL